MIGMMRVEDGGRDCERESRERTDRGYGDDGGNMSILHPGELA